MIDTNIGNITPSNLFRTIGQLDYVFTIIFNPQCKYYQILGSNITATLVYSKKERELFLNNDDSFIDNYSKGIIKVDVITPDLAVEEKIKYKLDGIECKSINRIFFIPYSTHTEPDKNGVKKVPNIISIPYESKNKLDYENMFCGLYSRLINKNEPLLYEEKIEYIGINSAFNGGRTSSKLLSHISLEWKEIQKESLFWKSFYETKEKLTGLNDDEKNDLEDHKSAIWFRKQRIFLTELLKGGKILENASELDEKIKFIFNEIENFKTTRFGFPLIYWDLETYLHIILRHIPDTKISANNLLKSDIPYDISDLKTLIDKILDLIEEEIEHHFSNKKGSKFFRSGDRAVYFNGDYYSIDIEPDGRISSFYKN